MDTVRSSSSDLRHIERALSALNCGAAVLDRQGIIIYANTRYCEMLDRPAAQITQRNIRAFYPAADDREFVDRALTHADEARDFEFVVPRADGSRIPAMMSARPLPAPLNALHVVTVIDISAQKRAEAELRDSVQILSQVGDNAMEHALELKDYSETLERKVRERTEDLRQANIDAIYMLAIASEAKDADTGRHVRRIQRFAEALAREVGLPDDQSHALGYSAIMHDIGKIHVPDDILKKPGPLDDSERFVMKQHTLFGERILSKRPFFEQARRIARSHHENWDGTGYPDGLAGEKIPLEARIVRVVDVYDALTTARVYKKAWTSRAAIDFIEDAQNVLFERDAAKAFQALVENGAIDHLGRDIDVIEEV